MKPHLMTQSLVSIKVGSGLRDRDTEMRRDKAQGCFAGGQLSREGPQEATGTQAGENFLASPGLIPHQAPGCGGQRSEVGRVAHAPRGEICISVSYRQ